MQLHVCKDIASFPLHKFHQLGSGNGAKLLIVGESPAPNGWVISGKACYRPDGKLLATGKRLNELLVPLDISVEQCGFTELSKCIIDKRSELQSCSEKCWPIFLKQLESREYKVILVLGVQTTKILAKLLSIELHMGEIIKTELNGKNYDILPIFHPSPINPTGRAKNRELFGRAYPQLRSLLKK